VNSRTYLGGAIAALLVILVAIVGWTAFGGGGMHGAHDADDHAAMMGGSTSMTGGTATAKAGHGMTDAAFVAGMIPHHQGAIDMAQVVLDRSRRPELRALAKDIIRTQTAEIALMQGWQADGTVGEADSGDMGAMMDDGAMMMGGMSADELRTAPDVDRAFLEAMIPHHQSAVMMAEMVKARNGSPEVAELADGIVAAQEREIAEMRQWLKDWYGA
jgi:uncharacterized protein (DUF305 family)